jgi:NAD(P)-dependent dehydrogenase (short-subunit alcohol dehydrogenase family)
MLDPSGRVIMVSGANRGIGLATARHLAGLGYSLSLGARDPSAIPGGEWLSHEWQATDAASGKAWVEATLERFGRIDGVVMNAGIDIGGALLDGPEEQFDAMWEVNFKGPLRLARACLPALRASGTGRVINVVSLAGKRVLRNEVLGYSASKHAALALTHAIRRAGWDDGVRATAVCPGMVETDMTAELDAPAGQFKIAPETIAASIAYALALPNEAVVAELLINSRFEPLF